MSISSPEQFARLCVSLDKVGWTYHTADGGLSVHYEHTVVITKDKPIILTAV